MNSMLEEKGISFKEIEQEIFKIICEVGRALMKGIFARA